MPSYPQPGYWPPAPPYSYWPPYPGPPVHGGYSQMAINNPPQQGGMSMPAYTAPAQYENSTNQKDETSGPGNSAGVIRTENNTLHNHENTGIIHVNTYLK
jgi:hypothetical protein